jgi:uncharacterized protein (TIGR03067 family)
MHEIHLIVALISSVLNPVLVEQKAKEVDAKLLQGVWRLVQISNDGKSIPEDYVKTMRMFFVFEGTVVKVGIGETPPGMIQEPQSDFALTTSTAPRQMTLIPRGPKKGDAVPAIYLLKDDSLTIAQFEGKASSTPPEDFKGGKHQTVLVFKREKVER